MSSTVIICTYCNEHIYGKRCNKFESISDNVLLYKEKCPYFKEQKEIPEQVKGYYARLKLPKLVKLSDTS